MSLVRKLLKRERIDSWLDRFRFGLDRFPSMDYQPMPWLGVNRAGRSGGAASRWQRIESLVAERKVATALDLGCNVGYFSIQLALRGATVLAVESEPKFFRMAQYGVRRLHLDNLGLLSWKITPDNVHMLPATDCVLFLSVWHHMVREHGLDAATEMLRHFWSNTRAVLFFETGESEMPAEFRLPDMGVDSAHFLTGYLKDHCIGGEVLPLGKHDAFAPGGKTVQRNLFGVIRR